MSAGHEDVEDVPAVEDGAAVDGVAAVDPETADRAGASDAQNVTDRLPAAPAVPAEQLRAAVEAILMIVDEPVGQVVLAQVLATPEPAVADVLRSLRAEYDDAGRGFE